MNARETGNKKLAVYIYSVSKMLALGKKLLKYVVWLLVAPLFRSYSSSVQGRGWVSARVENRLGLRW
jgi:hypothetical protein